MPDRRSLAAWFARLALGGVFAMNLAAALAFILRPEVYMAGFEVSGVPGKNIVQGFGILFLMWNATYPPVILHPGAHKTLFIVILVQQFIGVLGETWLWLSLPTGHPALSATGLRFIFFDSLGLLMLAAAFAFLHFTRTRP